MPIVETIKILRRIEWQSANKIPASSPDWQIYEVKNEESSMENRGGINYRVITLRRVLVPLKAGQLKLPDWVVQIEFIDASRRRSSSPFDIFSGATVARRQLGVEAKEVDIAPMSEADIPVGILSPGVSVSSQNVKVGDSLTIEFKVSGLGWFSGLKLEPPELTGRFKLYKDQPVTREEASKSGLEGDKSLKLSLVPSEAGRLEFSPWIFRFFDPSLGKVVEKSVAIPAIEVSGSAEVLISSGGALPKGEASQNSAVQPQPTFYSGSPSGIAFKGAKRELIYWLFGFAIFLILTSLGVFSYEALQAKRIPEYNEVIRAWKSLRRHLRKESSLESKIRAFKKYASLKLRANENAVTVGDVIEALKSDQWRKEALSEVSVAFNIMEAQKFSGESRSQEFAFVESIQEVKRKKPCFR
jgi:hypothetical protein